MEMSFHEHRDYQTEADALHDWIVSTSETVECLTADIDSQSKEQLELTIIKLNVIIVNNN